MAATTSRDELFRLICGFQISQAIMVAASLRLADHLEGVERATANESGTQPARIRRRLAGCSAH